GRQQECDLCIPLMIVSRKHCQVNQDEGTLRVRDLGSRNGTFVNGEKIEEAGLNAGDKLRVGPIVFGVQVDGQPVVGDSAILRPPQHITAEKDVAKVASEEFADLEHVDTIKDHSAQEVLEAIGDDLGGEFGPEFGGGLDVEFPGDQNAG
ncbi:MAG: FHA domain-containing protein, partial [Planctomycetes bacterium]|nr:FHA domain-containing protein [Planctomycetota bacterium]